MHDDFENVLLIRIEAVFSASIEVGNSGTAFLGIKYFDGAKERDVLKYDSFDRAKEALDLLDSALCSYEQDKINGG